jgi:cytidylate kinase
MSGARTRAEFVVAIDGPAGSGKSTTARLCARELGFDHLDTGAMYRAVTLKTIEAGVDLRQNVALDRMLAATSVTLRRQRGGLRVLLDGRDVSRAIREPRVSGLVSEVAATPAVRRKLVAEQRRFARGRRLVCEGRDIGSVVFPDAGLKVFLECDRDERGRRRQRELGQQGREVSLGRVVANLAKRDRIDSGRKMSPLRRMCDAVLVDTTHLTVEEQVGVVCALARRRLRSSG